MSYIPRLSTLIRYFLMPLSFMLITLLMVLPFGDANTASATGLADLFGNSDNAAISSVQDGQKEFLNVDEAFTVIPTINASRVGANKTELSVLMEVTPGHYIYKDRVTLTLPEGVSNTPFSFNQTANFVEDPLFGQVAVFDQPLITAKTTISYDAGRANASASTSATSTSATSTPVRDITLTWQGCSKAGLCYPPQREKLVLPASLFTNAQASSSATATQSASRNAQPNTNVSSTTRPTTPEVAVKPATPNSISAVQSSTSTRQSVSSQQVTTPPTNQATRSNNGATNSTLQSEANTTSDNDINSRDNTSTDNVLSVGADNSSEIIGSDIDSDLNEDLNIAIDDVSNTTLLASETNPIALSPLSGTAIDNQNLALQHEVNVDNDPFGLATHPFLAFALLFLAGLTLAFTPCVLPMLPIVSNIIAHQHKPSAMQGALLTSSYALGVAVAYGILGALVAVFGVSLGILGWLQNPVVLLGFVAVFAIFALYMMDTLTWRTPRFISDRLGQASKLGDKHIGSLPGSFGVGLLSALVVSPCVSFPLFGALLAVSTIGNPILGFIALFMLGLGLSTPLILLGATQANFMPKAGEWMNWIKMGFALMLFAVSLLLVERVFISPLMLLLWALWFLVVARWLWSWQERGLILTKALAGLLGVWAVCLVVGAATGSQDTWQPLGGLIGSNSSYSVPTLIGNPTASNNNNLTNNNGMVANNTITSTPLGNKITVTSLAELDNILAQQPNVLVDVVAEWCVECRIMEKALFTNPPASLGQWQVVKLDITESDANAEAVLQRYQIPGPPTLLYYVDGSLQKMQVGEVSRDEFEVVLGELNSLSL